MKAFGSRRAQRFVAGSGIFIPPERVLLRFEEGSGDTAYDTSGNNWNVDLNNNVGDNMWTSGVVGSHALEFNGTDQSTQTVGNNVIGSGNFTVAAHINSETVIDGSIVRVVFAKASDDDSDVSFEFVWDHVADTFQQSWAFYTNKWESVKYSEALQTNTNYHIAMTYNNMVVRIYLNKVFDRQLTLTGNRSTGNYRLFIGSGHQDAVPSNRFQGVIDDFKEWDTVLTDEQIGALP